MQYLFLVLAIGSEVVATLSLRVAAHGRPKLYLPVAIGYLFAFAMLTATLREGMPLGVAYGIWAAAGVAITAIASHRLFHEALTRRMLGGIALIAVGVLLLELGAGH